MIDLHSHILPGLDDGPETLAESLEVARAAVDDGIEAVAATPHVREDYPTTAEAMEQAVTGLREALAAERIELELLTGGEIALDRLLRLDDGELRRFSLAGSGAYLLLEFPYYGWPVRLEETVFRLAAAGLRPVLAHPERSRELDGGAERLRPAVEAGALVQLTAASLDGRLGGNARRRSLELLERGLAHLVASDAHAPALRGIGMSAASEAVGDDELARWLTQDVPAAIVAGADPPPRPERRRRRRRWF